MYLPRHEAVSLRIEHFEQSHSERDEMVYFIKGLIQIFQLDFRGELCGADTFLGVKFV